ncbi:MAG: cobyric acid synthase [Bacillota bacterium]
MAVSRSIMLQGTSSNVGKSVLCTALCRIFHQEGYRVAPFKAQNMALNSAVTPDGGEIGRAQGAQAEAAGIKATVHMNPILIKPKQDLHAQIIVLGRPIGDMSAKQYRSDYLAKAEPLVQDSINRLKEEYDVLVIEGAGSPAEINLKDRDIVNMKTAELADAPVLLVADIDRGGVFASLIGTLELLEPHERARVKGFIINKFRGDLDLLKPGLVFLEERTGIPVLGVIPYIHDHGIDEEDSVCLSEKRGNGALNMPVQIAVIQLPRISNFTDFNPFFGLPGTSVRFVQKGEPIGDVDAVIIPGTKNSILDLVYLKEEGYFEEILKLADRGKYIVGICGGYQMLGRMLFDPHGTEAGIGDQEGLGLLPCVTTFGPEKSTHQVEGVILYGSGFWKDLAGKRIKGYEIHMGQSEVLDENQWLVKINVRSGKEVQLKDGAVARAGKVFGTHIHGLFDNTDLLLSFINSIRIDKGLPPLEITELNIFQREKNYDKLAAMVKNHLDMERLYRIMGG